MFNVLIDRLPDEWQGYKIDTDFKTGIQIMQCLQDEEFSEEERMIRAIELLFLDTIPEQQKAEECLTWYMNEFNHDNKSKSKKDDVIAFDFDIDQWRIYSAFRRQYQINLNTAKLHWFEFMGLLMNLEECSFTRVVDIRLRKQDPKAGREEKQKLQELKAVYVLNNRDNKLTAEELEAEQRQLEIFNNFMKAGHLSEQVPNKSQEPNVE